MLPCRVGSCRLCEIWRGWSPAFNSINIHSWLKFQMQIIFSAWRRLAWWRDGRWSCCQRMQSAHLVTCGCLPPEWPFSNNDILILLVELDFHLYIHLKVTVLSLIFLWSLLIRPLSFSSLCLLSTSADGFLFNQVYVRRAYIAYELNSVQHRQLKDNTCVVEFQFMLPTSHPNRSDHAFRCLWSQGLVRDLLSWHRNLTVELAEKWIIPVHQISTNFLG